MGRVMKPCERCGGPKGDVKRGARYCVACAALPRIAPPKPPSTCEREGCDEPKRPGKGRKLCVKHHAEAQLPRKKIVVKKPCAKCGGEKDRSGSGKRYCSDCAEVSREAARARKRAKQRASRKPCRGCGKRIQKQTVGAGHPYCDACEAERQDPRRRCNSCGEKKLMRKHSKICEDCRERVAEKRRAKQREYTRRMRQDPARLERMRAQQRLAKARENREKKNERARLNYRLRKMRIGETVKPSTKIKGENVTVPIAPLLPFLKAWIAHWEATNKVESSTGSGSNGGRRALAKEACVSERRLFDFLNGAERISRDSADKLCIAVGVHFSNIYEDVEATKKMKGANAA